jgi:hypothetical protein
MRRRRQWPEWWPPHNPFLLAEAQEIGQIRMTPMELLYFERTIAAGYVMGAQIGSQLRPIELFFLADVAELGEGLIMSYVFVHSLACFQSSDSHVRRSPAHYL